MLGYSVQYKLGDSSNVNLSSVRVAVPVMRNSKVHIMMMLRGARLHNWTQSIQLQSK